jgi:molecular chaperone GrpE (heat shock protein)
MEISLNKDSVVNQHTGEVSAPSEFVENLRTLEVNIARLDDQIGELQADLKAARAERENAVQALRAAVREGKVLPLLEVAEQAEDDDWGDQPEKGA